MSDYYNQRRRFQFRLRTLMIGVTLFALIPCGYVGWQKRIIERRNAWISEHHEYRFISEQEAGGLISDYADQQPSRIRLWLGDTSWSIIGIPSWQPEADFTEARSLFPEAWVAPEF